VNELTKYMEVGLDGQPVLKVIDIFRDYYAALPTDKQIEVLNQLGMERAVYDQLLKRLAEGWGDYWRGDDWEVRLEILTMMEKTLLSDLKWHIVSQYGVAQRAKNARLNAHIYWLMWNDEQNREFFQRWLSDNKLASNYTTEDADEDIREIRDEISNVLDGLNASRKAEVPE
jgi:hypothetical protein